MDRDAAVGYVHKLLASMLDKRGSDLYITADAAPSVKVDSELMPLTNQALNESSARLLVRSIMNDRQLKQFEETMECNFSISLPGKARFRVNAFTQRGCAGMVLRHIPTTIPDFKQLGLPPIMRDLVMTKRGLIIMVGATGSGKSTTLAAMIDYINDNYNHHILTIEDPIEFVHQSKQCLVNQREVFRDTKSFNAALRSALREDPDIILVGEMRDLETIRLALTAAETGHLVFGTLHTTSAAKTIDRIIDVFPGEEKSMVRSMLSESMRAVISQTLMKKNGGGRIAAHEIMIGIPAIRNLIREDKVAQMYSVIQTGMVHGMQTMDYCLKNLVSRGLISVQDAKAKAVDPNSIV